MKKLDVRFDTVAVIEKLEYLSGGLPQSKSEIARAAMNLGLDILDSHADADNQYNTNYTFDAVEEFK